MKKLISEKYKSEINLILSNFKILKNNFIKNLDKLCIDAIKCCDNDGKIIFFGNGGSASDAQHLATELTVRYKKNRKAISALSLSTDTSALTAIGNDFEFDQIFSRQIEAIGKKNDLIIAITTSGNSKNILKALKQANKQKIKAYVLVGNSGGKVKSLTKNCIIFPKASTSVTQVMQIAIGQVFCDVLESKLS